MVVFRDKKHIKNNERLNLNNRNLQQCPTLKGEQNLRLLNYENNNILKINNLQNLKNLIFLDLYNNKIKRIENLECLPLLRVLMLGRNLVSKIENLSTLKFLDVLDLHSNEIKIIEGLEFLLELRVLNLAGNEIEIVENMHALLNLVELNLRRNKISCFLHSFAIHTKLQRVLLSNNKICNIQKLIPVTFATNIQQLTIDNNPLLNDEREEKHTNPIYLQIISLFPNLKQLNNYSITALLRQQLLWNSNKTKINDAQISDGSQYLLSTAAPSVQISTRTQSFSLSTKADNISIDSEKNNKYLTEIENEMKNSLKENSNIEESAFPLKIEENNSFSEINTIKNREEISKKLIADIEKQWIKSRSKKIKNDKTQSSDFVQKEFFQFSNENKILQMYGCGMPAFHKSNDYNCNINILQNIQELEFNFVDFNDVNTFFNYFKTLKNLQSIIFNDTNIHSLYQIDALSVVLQIKRVVFSASNPITQTSAHLYRLYCIFRLPNVIAINEESVTDCERKMANMHFHHLREQWKNKSILLTRGFCPPVLNEVRNIYDGHFDEQKNGKSNVFKSQKLFEILKDFPVAEKSDSFSWDMQNNHGLNEKGIIAKECVIKTKKIFEMRKSLREMWPSIIGHLIEEVIQDLRNA